MLAFGGASSEHEVSIRSALNVLAAVDRQRYDVILAFIDKQGAWWLADDIAESMTNMERQAISIDLGAKSFVASERKLPIDVAFPVLHGLNGEDGTIQGLLEMLEIPYVGCGVMASALCMDKLRTKELVQCHDIDVAPWLAVTRGGSYDGLDISQQLGRGPWFVKPARGGSSIGVSKVYALEEMDAALDAAHQHDDIALIEAAIVGRELEVAVLGSSTDMQISGVGEIVAGADFYDYDDKYATDSRSQTKVSAGLEGTQEDFIRSLAGAIYQALGCYGLARVDFLMDQEGRVYLNEVNTMPGFTNISMYPKMMEAIGVDYSSLIQQLIDLALKR